MKYEMKISLPVSKIVYAVLFVVILSLIRGVTFTYEIGIALEPPMAMLAAVFCADTYTQEITSKRSEIQRLYPMKKRIFSICSRIAIQDIFLWFLAAIGYGLFLAVQKPSVFGLGDGSSENEAGSFLVYLFAIVITIGFWGLLSNLLSCLFRNMWMGIAGSMVLWVVTNSSVGDRFLGAWNLFSYTFRNVENSTDFGWIYGKIVCICVEIIIIVILPKLVRKRG